jgi:hypothetical protein
VPKPRRSSTRRCLSSISAADLLSRVSAETPHSQASGSHLSDRRDRPRASPRTFARASTRHCPRRRRIAVAGISGPEWRRSWCRASSRCQHHRPEGLPGVPSSSPCGLCRPYTRPMRQLTGTSCRTLSPPSASRARFLGAVTCFRAVHQDCTRSAGPRRLPPAGPISSAPRIRSELGSRAATGTLALPPWAQLPTCFHARLRRTLGPSPVPAFAGAPEPHAAYRLLQQSVPRTHLRAAQTPSLIAAASRCAPGGDTPCGAPPTELFQARGLSGLSALSTPTTTTARRSGFTPT